MIETIQGPQVKVIRQAYTKIIRVLQTERQMILAVTQQIMQIMFCYRQLKQLPVI